MRCLESRLRWGEKLITISVGMDPHRKEYQLHEKPVCDCSRFFTAAFQGAFRESVEKAITFPEEDPAVFDVFAHWLYTGLEPTWPRGEDMVERPYLRLAVVAMAGRLLIPDLKTWMTELLMGDITYTRVPNGDFVEELYENDTFSKSPLREYTASIVAYRIRTGILSTTDAQEKYVSIPQFGIDFLRELAAAPTAIDAQKHPREGPRFVTEAMARTGGVSVAGLDEAIAKLPRRLAEPRGMKEISKQRRLLVSAMTDADEVI